ncbi:3D domain-containing protein [Bdellovibrio sp. HCB274]|uniref:3D domain-containing protein n=1 Tax=Bdellovibrio sp. HCB274 TaxID=3394361 RepID=UPI0039B58BB4
MLAKRLFTFSVVVATMALAACGNVDQFTANNTLDSESGQVSLRDQSVHSALDTNEEWESTLPTQKATVGDPEDFPAPASAEAEPDATPSHGTINEEQVALDRPAAKDVVGSAKLKPTVYYFPIFDTEKTTCPDSQKVTLYGQGGKTIIRVCKKISDACGLQGSCSIKKNGKIRLLNILARIKGQNRYFEIDREECKYGYGVRTVCLDPFHTLAADLTIYKIGEVIYVPSVIGLILPDGTMHDGYFIIRDKGSGIMGRGRFDFYSGFMPWYDKTNPFNKIGLADKNTEVPYMRITGSKAKEIQVRRNYPSIPKDNQPLK